MRDKIGDTGMQKEEWNMSDPHVWSIGMWHFGTAQVFTKAKLNNKKNLVHTWPYDFSLGLALRGLVFLS